MSKDSLESQLMRLETKRPRSLRGRFSYERAGIPSVSRPDRPRSMEDLTVAYHRRWCAAREGRIEKAIADMLGHAREHTAIVEVPPWHRNTMTQAFAGIDRSVHPTSLQWANPTEPFSMATLREAVLRMFATPRQPPVKPWITQQRATELHAAGISYSVLLSVFDVLG